MVGAKETGSSEAVVMALFAALGGEDFDALSDLASDEIVYTIYGERTDGPKEIPWAGAHHGLKALATAFRAIHTALEVHVFETETVIADGETVAVFGSYEATARATGRRFRTPFAQRAQLKAGKVVKCTMLEDSSVVVSATTA